MYTRKTKTKTKKICYTGIGSRKSGKHDNKQFLNAINNEPIFIDQCPKFIAGKKCKSCKKYQNYMKKIFKKIKKNMSYKLKKNEEKKSLKLLEDCVKCKDENQKKPCSLEEYMEYSGATYC